MPGPAERTAGGSRNTPGAEARRLTPVRRTRPPGLRLDAVRPPLGALPPHPGPGNPPPRSGGHTHDERMAILRTHWTEADARRAGPRSEPAAAGPCAPAPHTTPARAAGTGPEGAR